MGLMNAKGPIIAAVVIAAAALIVSNQRAAPPPASPATMAPAQMAQPAAPVVMPAAAVAPIAPMAGGDPVAPNYMARTLKVFEGHWQGMDGRLMTTELARKLNYPQGTIGVLLGEVTLNAARSGLLAGDVVVKVDDMAVASVEDFQIATRLVMNRSTARVTVIRKQGGTLRTLSLTLATEGPLGFAQVEGAPMIQAGDPRPHGYRGACTECHPIGEGFELTPDPDLINLPPPVITRDIAEGGGNPHENRGACEACHVIR
ncbi:MAG: PDZ domain-containing protein [Caulobacter sp.]|nr:PDZ domain-containing protein [Caulobacter sp.]